jgi:glutamine synthetase
LFTKEASTAGVDFLVGFESKFILLKSTNPVQAINEHSYGATNAFSSGSFEAKILREIAAGIQASGIEFEVYHAEAGPEKLRLFGTLVLTFS